MTGPGVGQALTVDDPGPGAETDTLAPSVTMRWGRAVSARMEGTVPGLLALALTLFAALTANAQTFTLDDNPAAPIIGPPGVIPGCGAEDQFALGAASALRASRRRRRSAACCLRRAAGPFSGGDPSSC